MATGKSEPIPIPSKLIPEIFYDEELILPKPEATIKLLDSYDSITPIGTTPVPRSATPLQSIHTPQMQGSIPTPFRQVPQSPEFYHCEWSRPLRSSGKYCKKIPNSSQFHQQSELFMALNTLPLDPRQLDVLDSFDHIRSDEIISL
jgi:hypothetical protein